MMGERLSGQERLFYEFRLEDRVPGDHLLRKIDSVDEVRATSPVRRHYPQQPTFERRSPLSP